MDMLHFNGLRKTGMCSWGDLGANYVGAAYAISGMVRQLWQWLFGETVWKRLHWNEESGMVGIGDLKGGEFRSSAFGVSRDGSIVIGNGSSQKGSYPFIGVMIRA